MAGLGAGCVYPARGCGTPSRGLRRRVAPLAGTPELTARTGPAVTCAGTSPRQVVRARRRSRCCTPSGCAHARTAPGSQEAVESAVGGRRIRVRSAAGEAPGVAGELDCSGTSSRNGRGQRTFIYVRPLRPLFLILHAPSAPYSYHTHLLAQPPPPSLPVHTPPWPP